MSLQNNKTPADYGLPHQSWREHQQDAIHWAEGLDSTGVLAAPTGSGKTALPAALSYDSRVVSLVRTKNLQREIYGNAYGFDVLFGRSNHPCHHPENFRGATAEDCLFGSAMFRCEHKGSCSYLIDKHTARKSKRASLNFAYALIGLKWWPSFDYLVLDEAHLASETVLDFVGIKLHEGHRKVWELPPFPRVGAPKPFTQQATDRVVAWLQEASGVLDLQRLIMAEHLEAHRTLTLSRKLARCERLLSKVDTTIEALEASPRDWFIRAGQKVIYRQGANGPGILARPLTARHDFTRLFHADKLLLMSATIGDTRAFVEELGIHNYEYLQVPNQFPPEARPIEILDAPKMGRSVDEAGYGKQADVIAEAILGCPPDWSGIIHVTRKKEAGLLAARLAARGLADRVWPMTGHDGEAAPTDQQVENWRQVRTKKPGAICISWSMWEGYDGLDEKICIVAKVPFPFLGDEYERARLNYSHRFYNWRTGCKLSQGLGRTRRGRKQDYDLNGRKAGLVAIADGNWSRVRKYFSQDVMEAII